MKVEIEFDADFETKQISPIPIARLGIGMYTARYCFCPDGKARLYIPEEAVHAGFVIVYPGSTLRSMT